MRLGFHAIALLCTLPIAGQAARPSYGIDDAVTVAKKQNLEIAIVRKQIQGARGGFVEARSGYLPSLASTGLYDKREHQQDTRLAMRITTFRGLEEELKTRQERLKAGTVGTLNVERNLRPPT